jgi:hypothetical protein
VPCAGAVLIPCPPAFVDNARHSRSRYGMEPTAIAEPAEIDALPEAQGTTQLLPFAHWHPCFVAFRHQPCTFLIQLPSLGSLGFHQHPLWEVNHHYCHTTNPWRHP